MYKTAIWILIIGLSFPVQNANGQTNLRDSISINYFGTQHHLFIEKEKIKASISGISNEQPINADSISRYLAPISNKINQLKTELELSDWLTYQLIRRIAEQITSKYVDYTEYTVLKWALLASSGYEPAIFTSNDKILLYVMSPDTIYNLPNKVIEGKQYVCLNYHDYGYQVNFMKEKFNERFSNLKKNGASFHYTIQKLPSFQRESYIEKEITFSYKQKKQNYRVLVNSEMQDYFTNYPVTEYRYQFNIPFSNTTYNSLIPNLKSNLEKLSVEDGVEYLMLFVRDGFQFETDTKLFGREKRLSAEETLAYNSSDCEDRSALFFLLVKELYNLPMAILSYTEHVNVGVMLPKNKGYTIQFNNKTFTVCEPTPQLRNKGIGWLPNAIKKQPFEIAYTTDYK
ncbi:MAG: hypothetical protein RLZZ595_1283 [Bacteroidota bacterium]|jgi:hypothetical protein